MNTSDLKNMSLKNLRGYIRKMRNVLAQNPTNKEVETNVAWAEKVLQDREEDMKNDD